MVMQTFGKKRYYDTALAYKKGTALKMHNKPNTAIIRQRQALVSPLVKRNKAIQAEIGKLIMEKKPLTPAQENVLIHKISSLMHSVDLLLRKEKIPIVPKNNGIGKETSRIMHEVLQVTGIRQTLLALFEEGLTKRDIYSECLAESKLRIKQERRD
jgi:hypothetical protein